MKQKVRKIIQTFLGIPKKYVFMSLGLIVFVAGLVSYWPSKVEFSYHQKTCKGKVTLAPDLFKTTGTSDFRIETGQPIAVGGVRLATRSVCFVPLASPQPGEHKVVQSPFGVAFLGKNFNVAVAKPPIVSAKTFAKPVPLSKPLEISLSGPDSIFQYELKVQDKSQACQSMQQKISCDVAKLNLAQGKEYDIRIDRYFEAKRVDTVLQQKMTTLSAVAVINTTVKPGETIYTKLKSLKVVLDKPVISVKSSLFKIEGDKRTEVEAKPSIVQKEVEISWQEDISRSVDYQLMVDKVVAQDGSTLADPYVLPFKTSGGPKVTGINIGKTGVAMGATAVITFDQPLSSTQDTAKIITTSGGAQISKKEANRVFVTLAAVPKCGDFAIAISNDLQSNYEVAGGTAWGYSSRTVCHTIGTIGYSAKGRAINAYYFGGGSKAIVYTGAIHGSESSTRALMLKWIDELEANAHKIPADKTVIVVPAINPDGIAAGTRTNGNNVDLNRNFGTSDWKTDVTTVNNTPFPGGGGVAAMSEPETKAIAGLVSRLRPQLVLSYHSIGGVVAANQAGNSVAFTKIYANLSGYGNVTGGSASTFEYAISGTAEDYYAEKLGVASILVELGSHSYHQFEKNQKAMWAMITQ